AALSLHDALPISFHGRSAGLRSASMRMRLSPTTITSPSTRTSTPSGPNTESYFSRCASVPASERSLMATNSMSGSFRAVRSTVRPMRPNPLIATRIAIGYVSSLSFHTRCPRPCSSRAPIVFACGRANNIFSTRSGLVPLQILGEAGQPAHAVVDGRLAERRVEPLAQIPQTHVGVGQPHLRGLPQRRRQLVQPQLRLDEPDVFDLFQGRRHRFLHVGRLRVDQPV